MAFLSVPSATLDRIGDDKSKHTASMRATAHNEAHILGDFFRHYPLVTLAFLLLMTVLMTILLNFCTRRQMLRSFNPLKIRPMHVINGNGFLIFLELTVGA